MKTNQPLLGIQSPGDELVIRNLRRIKRIEETTCGLFDGSAGLVVSEDREIPLNAWSGITSEGHPVHISYHIGEVTIQVDLPTPEGGRQSLTVLRWKPRLALGLVAPKRQSHALSGSAADREERARLAEVSAELAEIRSLNREKPRILAESELRHWLHEHHRHFALLEARGLAGSRIRFRFAHAAAEEEEAA